MPPTLRPLLLAIATATAPGCTHFANVTEVATTDDSSVYVSSRDWDDGTPRTIVTERVFERPEAPCDLLEIEREFYDQTGALLVRETDIETCRVVLMRTTEEYDEVSAQVRRTWQRDANRDGVFDVERVAYAPMHERVGASPRERTLREIDLAGNQSGPVVHDHGHASATQSAVHTRPRPRLR